MGTTFLVCFCEEKAHFHTLGAGQKTQMNFLISDDEVVKMVVEKNKSISRKEFRI